MDNKYIDKEVDKLQIQGYTSRELSREIENREIPEQELRYFGVINSGLVKDDNPLSFYDDKELIAIKDKMEEYEAEEMYNSYLENLNFNEKSKIEEKEIYEL